LDVVLAGCNQLHPAGLSKLARSPFKIGLYATVLSVSLAWPAQGLTLKELRADTALTPDRLLHYFFDFKFKLGEQVQSSEAFLSSKAGDCDDFATLAAEVLREKGYTPRLVVVFMEHQIHVVCYVPETKSYLDYNNRRLSSPAVPSNGTLPDIAQKVARTFRAPWTCASEFVYKNGIRQTLWTDFPQMPIAPRPRDRRSNGPPDRGTDRASVQP
jgi:hypothetical protein